MRILVFSALLLSALPVLGCSRGDSGSEPTSPPAATYTVRGIVRDLPEGGQGPVVIEHESIEKFRDNEGNVVGMHAMAMPFAPATGLSLEGFQKGDKVRFAFEVRWKEEPRLRLTKLEKLPPETSLELGGHAH